MTDSSPAASPILEALATLSRAPARKAKAKTVDDARFTAEGRLALDALALQVSGVGELGHPVDAPTAAALHAASTPARHGLREATLLDKRVRDTGEIGIDALTLRWREGALPALLAEVARGLGLPALDAHPHNLLVYGPGQFFKPHQDTEKHHGMVGTLVLVWPSAHIGGELRVRLRDETASFASQHLQADTLRWFAFYADCQHEVQPVSEGWRIVLTFDLVVPRVAAAAPGPVHPSLLAALRAHFFPEGQAPSTTPWVLLLDHQYTEHGLRWALIKGDDRPRVAALRAAADTLGLTAHLALAEIHQNWTATVGGRGRYGHTSEPEPDELIDEDMALDFWVDADDRPLRRAALPLPADAVHSLTDTDESFLVNEEYEGFMGNYGETLDYWYRRAALVIQTPLAAEASRFVTDFDGALADAQRLAREGRGAELTQRLQAAARTIEARRSARGRELLGRYAKLALALPDAEQARWLCEGFSWVDLQSADAATLAKLAARWGLAWAQSLLQAWAAPARHWHAAGWFPHGQDAAPPWPRALAEFVRAGQRAGLDATLVESLLDRCLGALEAADKALASESPAARNSMLANRLEALRALVQALELTAHGAAHIGRLVTHVQSHPRLYPLRGLRPLLLALSPEAAAQPAAKALRAAVVDALGQALAQPEPAAADRSLSEIEWTCRCADCRLVIDWATSPSAQPLTLAIAEARRTHVQAQLATADAPLRTETIKRGSPYRLLLAKPDDLPARRRSQRQAWADDLAALAAGEP